MSEHFVLLPGASDTHTRNGPASLWLECLMVVVVVVVVLYFWQTFLFEIRGVIQPFFFFFFDRFNFLA